VPPGYLSSSRFFDSRSQPWTQETYRGFEETAIEPFEDFTAAPVGVALVEEEARIEAEVPVELAPELALDEAPEEQTPEKPVVAPIQVAAVPEVPGVEERTTRVAWSSKKLSDIIQSRPVAPGSSTFELAPDPTRASKMGIGKNLELRPPAAGAVFRVNAARSLRAQVILREVPPEPFPRGMAGFSPVFEVLHSPLGVIGTTALTIALAPDVCSPERLGELKLYGYDRRDGWTPMYRQKWNMEMRSFSALDPAFRVYAILGPQDALLDMAIR